MAKFTKDEAQELYTTGNNEGLGYAPYSDVAGDDTVESAIEAAQEDGWELVSDMPQTNDDLAVLENEDGEVMAIGDAHGAWAVIISDIEENK